MGPSCLACISASRQLGSCEFDGVLGGGLPRLLWTLLPAVRSHSSSPPSTVWSPYGRGSAALVTKDSRNAVRSVSAPSLLKVFCSRIQSFVLAVQSESTLEKSSERLSMIAGCVYDFFADRIQRRPVFVVGCPCPLLCATSQPPHATGYGA
ncbi:hypothetical protein BD626DRAFT_154993 [Schizophyllum amplum]|uniref:Uncharacterized protein n=1 Tax=Schizophyllum amplum TaxID=97359 RepID=A0A550C3T0_9AGAR|nr:hypothetical protein BD626DRAFT_154993 [Auriculariopsis ampla]